MPGPWGEAIKRLRLRKGLTQAVIARRAKMTATTYGRIEKGQHTQTRLLQRIADVYSVSIEAVLASPLQSDHEFSQTPLHVQGSSGHGQQAAPVLASASAAELLDLRTQVEALQEELAEIAAEREAERQRRRRGRQHLSAARLGQSKRPKNARKPRS